MKKLFLLFSLLLLTFYTQAQNFPSEMWHNGKLVLDDDEVIEGKIKYDLKNDVIQLNSNSGFKTYSARQILYFEIYDETVANYRTFYSLPYGTTDKYKTQILFEVLYEGELTLLCRESLVTENVNDYSYNYAYGPSPSFTRTRVDYDYYFLDQKGNISDYHKKKKELLEIMGKKQSQIGQYIKKNNLKYDQLEDLVRITAYYNALL